jgi:hypothetical protein
MVTTSLSNKVLNYFVSGERVLSVAARMNRPTHSRQFNREIHDLVI